MTDKLAPNEKLIKFNSIMICSNCGKETTTLLEIHDKKLPPTFHVKTLTTIVYACPKCRVIIGTTKIFY